MVVEIDAGVSDPSAIGRILNEHSCKGLVFDPVAGDRYNSDILAETMPELATYDGSFGIPFRSRTVPSLKHIVHTGMEVIPGAVNFKHIMVYDPMTDLFSEAPPLDTPLSVKYDAGAVKG